MLLIAKRRRQRHGAKRRQRECSPCSREACGSNSDWMAGWLPGSTIPRETADDVAFMTTHRAEVVATIAAERSTSASKRPAGEDAQASIRFLLSTLIVNNLHERCSNRPKNRPLDRPSSPVARMRPWPRPRDWVRCHCRRHRCR